MSKLYTENIFEAINDLYPVVIKGSRYKISEINDDVVTLEDKNGNIIEVNIDTVKWLLDGINTIEEIQLQQLFRTDKGVIMKISEKETI